MGLITIPVHLASHREHGVLRRFRASGVGDGALLLAEAALGVVLSAVAATVVVLAGTGVYGFRMPRDAAGVVGWFLAGLVCFVTIGIALGSIMPSARAANAVGNLLFVPMLLLGGGGPPRGVMTSAMHALSGVLPLSHVVGGIRQAWLGATDDPHLLWWPLTVAATAAVAALLITRRRAA